MNVSQILSNKGADVFKLSADQTALEAAKTLSAHQIGAIPIVEGDRLVGIISERDLVRAVAAKGADSLHCPVTDLMTRGVSTCLGDTTLDDLSAMMTSQRIRHVPVLDGEKLVGIVSIGDVVKERLAAAAQETDALKEYIATG